MSIQLQTKDSGIRWNEAASLFTAVGWGVREPEHLREAFARSTYKCFAFDGAKLVGFGRTIGDGRYYATVVDMIVHLDYQRQGIASQITQNLQNAMQGFLIITLPAAPEVQLFYNRLGWRKVKTGMKLPRSENQARLNCE
jgi:hypothetical protein